MVWPYEDVSFILETMISTAHVIIKFKVMRVTPKLYTEVDQMRPEFVKGTVWVV